MPFKWVLQVHYKCIDWKFVGIGVSFVVVKIPISRLSPNLQRVQRCMYPSNIERWAAVAPLIGHYRELYGCIKDDVR